MKFHVITLFPSMLEESCAHGVLGRAIEQGEAEVHCVNPRDHTTDRHRTVDDRPYGGGPGMLMKVEPLAAAIEQARQAAGDRARVIYLSPQGSLIRQHMLTEVADQREDLILIAGRYEGIDQRLIDHHVDEEWSLGDFVLSGGEIAAMAVIDGVVRLLPGVLGDDESAQQDSFMNGLLDHPHYTRPEVVDGEAVPEVLLSGDHSRIETWRLKQALGRTWLVRPDLLEKIELDEEQQRLLDEFIREHEDSGA